MNVFTGFLQNDNICIIDINWVYFFKEKEMGMASVWVWLINTRSNQWERSVCLCLPARSMMQSDHWSSVQSGEVKYLLTLKQRWSWLLVGQLGSGNLSPIKQNRCHPSAVLYLLNFSHEVVNLSYCFPSAIAKARLLVTHL